MTSDFDPIDELLAHDAATDAIVPSSGFSEAVMSAVKQSRTMPPPIPFPWRRVLPWLAAAVILIALGAAGVVRIPIGGDDFTITTPAFVQDVLRRLNQSDTVSVAGGLLLALASSLFALRSGQLFQRR